MRRVWICSIVAVAVVLLLSMHFTVAVAKKVTRETIRSGSQPAPDIDLPPEIEAMRGPEPSSVPADTFVLHEANFDGPGGLPDPMGYVSVDLTAQLATFFHVADASELDGGNGGFMVPLSGAQSMWCGQAPASAVPFCGYGRLPGYGNGWKQWLVSDPLPGDSVSLSYRVFWESEPGYDYTAVEYSFDGGATWSSFTVGDIAPGGIPGVYDDTGPTPYLDESLTADSPGASDVTIRFRFESDGAYSDEDGLYDSDGAIIVDDITVQTWSGGVPAANEFEDFESAPVGGHAAGVWTGLQPPAYGDFAALYPGGVVYQEGDCYTNTTFFWGFFDDPMVTSYDCHLPDPLPNQGAVPYGKVINGETVYIENQIWSPRFANTGMGDEYRLRFQFYDDLPVDNLVIRTYAMRGWTAGCPGRWTGTLLNPFPQSGTWVNASHRITNPNIPTADELQVALGVLDVCGFYCGFLGTGDCHSHAPLFDNVRVERIAANGPRYNVRHVDLFQDNFAEDGTLTGTARADCADDILPAANPGILPGDSVSLSITGVGEVGPGMGPRAYLYAAVWPLGSKTGASLGSPDTRPGKAGPRFPYAGSEVVNGITWERFQMDTTFSFGTVPVEDRYCLDLNDAIFTPGDTICYFFGADEDAVDHNGNEIYWHRTINGQGESHVTDDIAEAAASPCEFTILPAGGYNRGGDFLFVDDADDRGGPAQLFFDSALGTTSAYFDRYDILGPSSNVGNSLDSRVKDRVTQIIDVYQTILWNSSNLSSGTVGDGVGPEKSDDFGLLDQFISTSPDSPGLYLFGDNIAEEWVTLSGTGAQNLKNQWMPFALVDGDHIAYGEPVTPLLTATGPAFIHSLVPDQFYIYGGCPVINDFDVLQPLSSSIATTIIEFPYPNSGDGAVISAQDTNLVNSIYTILLTGFGFDYIRDVSHIEGTGLMARKEFLKDAVSKSGNTLFVPTGIEPDAGPELVYSLLANYPNPFNPVTTIEYSIKERAHVSLKIYNAAGQLVRTLVDDVQSPADVKPLTWDGTNNAGRGVSSGVYFYRMVTKNFVKTRKMVLLK